MARVKITAQAQAPKEPKSTLTSKAAVQKAMLAKLSDSALDSKDAKLLCYSPYTAVDAKGLLPGKLPVKAGFILPYFDMTGKPTKFWRYRYLETTKEGWTALTDKKAMRYVQSSDTVNEVYLPPFANWEEIAKDTTIALTVTEGELKAACATKLGFPTLGLGGVWCFRAAKKNISLLPMLASIAWKDRDVFICYDSDAATNPLVMAAENALAHELTMLGAHIYIVRLPALVGHAKVGLDDYLVAEGGEAFTDLTEKALEEPWAQSRELHKLNEEVVLVEDPGLIIKLSNLQRMSRPIFTDVVYANRVYTETMLTKTGTTTTKKSAAVEWLKWPMRSAVPSSTYAPGQARITTEGALNTWTGWGCEPVPGDITPWRKLLEFIFAGEPELIPWFEQWCAYPLQHPGTKMFTSVVVHGREHGTGKTLLGHTLFRIYGSNSTEITDNDLSNGSNDWAESKQFVLGEEITGGDKRGVADSLKKLITQKTMRINIKYVPRYEVPDCINYLFTSNHPDAFFLEDKDRRYCINEVQGAPLSRAFYDTYDAWLNSTGPQHLFHHLLNVDLTGFSPKAHAPMSQAKRNMIDVGRSDLASWVAMLREDPDSILRVGEQVLDYSLWTATDLLRLYDPEGKTRTGSQGMGRVLAASGVVRLLNGNPVKTSAGSQRLWALRNADKMLRLGYTELAQHYDHERGVGATARKAKGKK